MILFPAFRLQDLMQKATLGERRWTVILEMMNTKREIQEYRDMHDGLFPLLTGYQSFKMSFCCMKHETTF
jgi:hypothetical protein